MCKSDNETRKCCKVMILDGKIKIPDKFHGGINTVGAGLTLILYFKVYLSADILL